MLRLQEAMQQPHHASRTCQQQALMEMANDLMTYRTLARTMVMAWPNSNQECLIAEALYAPMIFTQFRALCSAALNIDTLTAPVNVCHTTT